MTQRFTWTDENVAELERLAATGHTGSMIASILGATRNAVVGKCYRIGVQLPGLRPSLPKPKAEPKPPKPPKAAAPKPARQALRVVVCEPAPVGGVTFMELERHQCRWPLGGPKQPAVKFCGADKIAGRPYCATHTALAYTSRAKSTAPKPFNFSAKRIRPRLPMVAAE